MMTHKSSSKKRGGITLTSSFANTPLTPPGTDEKASPSSTFPGAKQIVALFKEIKSGHVGESQPWKKFQLEPKEYGEIERLLLADTDASLWGFVDDKIRYDFDADRNQVVVRMPTPLHELFLEYVKRSIEDQLRSFASSTTLEESVIHFAQCLRNGGSPDIFFPPRTDSGTYNTSKKSSKNSPDGTFHHKDAQWPGVILEVSYSTKRKDLPKLADKYILDSNASVRAVVGLDIEYKRPNQTQANSREVVFSVWQPEIVQNDGCDLELVAAQKIKDQPFRDTQGNPISSPDLSLRLSSFSKLTENCQKADGKRIGERYIRRTRRRPSERYNNHIRLSQRINQLLHSINYFNQNHPS